MNKYFRRAPLARRRFLCSLAGLAAAPPLPRRASARPVRQPALVEVRLVAAPESAQLVPKQYPGTDVWAYNGTTPGPVLRVRQGDRPQVVFADPQESSGFIVDQCEP